MAKKPRMGRNLNALLGGAARERTGKRDEDIVEQERVSVTEPGSAAANQDEAVASQSPIPDQNAALTGMDTASVTNLNEPESGAPGHSDESVVVDPPVAPVVTPMSSESVADSQSGSSAVASGERLIMLGVEKIRRGTYQPRRLFDQELLHELAESIKAEGMIQPIIVRPFADGYELVAGERRWRASQLAGIDQIPAIVRSMEDRSVAAVSVIENIQRKDLNPLEEAAAFERLCDEFGMTHKAVAEAVGRSRASVTNLMRLLELHDEVKVLVDRGELEMGHARALLGVTRNSQPEIARRVIKQGMTVRAVEKYIRSLDADGNEIPPSTTGTITDPDIERLSKKLGDKLGARVQITHKSNGAGKLQISYSSVSELQGILAHIK